MRTPELLAPGGSFLSAFYAFEAGADGVYLGMKDFSARAAAQNFSLEQLRRIRQLAADRGRRIYVTVNTVIRDDELPRLRESLAWLEALRVDGVIVQDLGVCDLLRREFPGLAIHASTQMGIHNDTGLQVARELGVRRAILSRELPLDRIRALRERHPDVELEVFIHGALCYSFSGACLASWALTGRSGNRGECAQVCRSVFMSDGVLPGGEAPAEGHLFSTRDLFLGRDVLDLARVGVDALKIEGRMKSPEYVFHVTRLYREVLDRGEALPADRYEELVRNAELGFSRTKTTGWLRSARGTSLLETGAPGHRGAVLGVVRTVRGRRVELRLEADVALRDGIGYLHGNGKELAAFSALSIIRDGRDVPVARSGQTVSIEVPPDAAADMPRAGQELRHLSSRSLDLPQPREGSFPLYQVPVDLQVRLGEGGLFEAEANGCPRFSGRVTLTRAESRRPFEPILSSLLRESGVSLFRARAVELVNESGLPGDGIFVRPSELKRLKNDLYAHLDRSFMDSVAARAEAPKRSSPAHSTARSPLAPPDLARLSDRRLLGLPGQAPIPFVGGDPGELRLDSLADVAGFRWLPLPPVLVEDSSWISAVRALALAHPESPIAVGLNNASHLACVSALRDIAHVWFFADFFLYAANEAARALLAERIPRLLFVYEWLEGPAAPSPSAAGSGVPLIRVSTEFEPPLFTSLGCFVRHSARPGSCPADCPRDFGGELRQGRNRFRLVVRDCVTYLFRLS